jgi:hypothetical protein
MAAVAATVVAFTPSCSEKPPVEPTPTPAPAPTPTPNPENVITILGETYNFKTGGYMLDHFDFVDCDVACFYIELTGGAAITIEMSQELLGKRIQFEPSDDFWFFSIGDGKGPFRSVKNSREDFKGYSGWLDANLNGQTDACTLEFELLQNGERIANGKVNGTFERLFPREERSR